MSTDKIQSLNPDIANDRISMPYPHLELLEPSNAVALVLEGMPAGELPVVCEYQGTTRKLKSIPASALYIRHLLSVSKLSYNKTAGERFPLRTNIDILEALG